MTRHQFQDISHLMSGGNNSNDFDSAEENKMIRKGFKSKECR